MTILKGLLAAGVVVALGATAANAKTITFNSAVVPQTTTDFTGTPLVLQQFDPSLGTLSGISVHLHGDIVGGVQAQNLSDQASTVTFQLGASLTLERPDMSTIVVSTPVISQVVNLAAFSGNLMDFTGPDAVSMTGQTASKDNTVALGSSDFSLFTGTGTVAATLSGAGASTASGGGNLLTIFSTTAGGFADVTYTYNTVPEPAAIALLGLGMGVIGFARRRAK